jgi:hypothetical protein
MSRKAWVVFVLVQLFGELGPWAGLHMKSALGPALWVAGMVAMMPGRALSLWVEHVLWTVRLTPLQSNVGFVVIEVGANVCVWLLCALLWRSLRRRRSMASPAS